MNPPQHFISRDSAGSGATEEGLTSRGGRNLRLPLGLALGSPIFPSGCEGRKILKKLFFNRKKRMLFRHPKHRGVPPALVTTHSFSHSYLLSTYSMPGMVLSFRGNPGESGLVSRGSQGLRSPLESRRGSLGAP